MYIYTYIYIYIYLFFAFQDANVGFVSACAQELQKPFPDSSEGAEHEAFHVFQNYDWRPVLFYQPGDVKQNLSSFVFGSFLFACDGERLTGEPGAVALHFWGLVVT